VRKRCAVCAYPARPSPPRAVRRRDSGPDVLCDEDCSKRAPASCRPVTKRRCARIVGPGSMAIQAPAAVDDVAVVPSSVIAKGWVAQPGDARAHCYHVFSRCGGK